MNIVDFQAAAWGGFHLRQQFYCLRGSAYII